MAAISEPQMRAGDIEIDIAPAIGGSIASFRLAGIDLMRPLSAANRQAGNVLGVASFPMIPYANRIARNAFDFDGRHYSFEMNNPPEIYNVHGTAWHRAWTVEQANESGALISLEVSDPLSYSYRAAQEFRLDQAGLDLVTTVTNRGAFAMPFGLGHHPWFHRDPEVTVQFGATHFHLNEPEVVIGQRIALPPELSFNTAQKLPDYWRCSDYGGWDRAAAIRFPTRGIGLTMRGDAPYKHIMFYADPELDVFCVEPQTNASGAFNRPGGFEDPLEGIAILAPGQSFSGTLRFEPFRL